MELKPTFFSVSGFLVPGIVLVGSVSCLFLGRYYDSIPAIVAAFPALPAEGAGAVLLGTLVAAVLLAVTFAIGAVLSELFIYIGRRQILRRVTRSKLREYVRSLFAHSTLEELVRADMNAREAYVYIHTCGLDLHWYAGRIRMMGGTGLALLITASVCGYLGYRWYIFVGFVVPAALALAVAMYRSHKFDEYVAATSAVIARGGAGRAKIGDEA